MIIIYSEIIDGKEYRYVELRGRGKLIARDGDAINPFRRNQKVTIHYNEYGYPCFGGGVPVHLYVAHAWVDGYFDGAEVNHKDFNRDNYNADNLEWVSHLDNIYYTLANNYDVVCKSKQGENNGRAILCEDDVYKIRKLYSEGLKPKQITNMMFPEIEKNTREYKNMIANVSNAARRNTWKHLK